MKQKDNYGFSLVELIVVILIMGIISVSVAVGINASRNADSDKSAGIIATVIGQGRQQAMTKSNNVNVRIYKNASGRYFATVVYDGVDSEAKDLGDKITIKAKKLDGTEVPIDATGILISFNKGSGVFDIGSGSYDVGATVYQSIMIHSSKTVTVYLVSDTGRTYIR